ncbi:hypothetical protein D9M68_557670 [compost metagenome]
MVLVFTCFWTPLAGLAQSANSGPQDVSVYGPAINISTFHTEETEADLYFADAEKSERRGDLNEALTLFGKAAFEYNTEKKPTKYAGALLRMSNVHYLLAHYTEAEQIILNVALKTYSRVGSKVGQMASYGQLGKIYLGNHKLTQSLWFFTQQGILAQQLKNNASHIESIIGIAQVKVKKKEYSLALKDLNRAELLAKNYKISHFNRQIKANRSLIAERQSVKK